MSSELDKIAAEGAADIAAAVPAPAAAAAPQVDPREALAQEIGGLVASLVAMAAPAFPSLSSIYTEQTIPAASMALAGVCVKHGWLSGGVMGEHGEEISALMICGPLAVLTYQGVRADLAKLKGAKPAPEAKPAEPPPPPAPDGHKPMTLPKA